MRARFNNTFNKNLLKIFFGSGISTTIKIITTLILSKVIAEKLGPQGLGLIGQLTSFVSITLLVGLGGYQNGIISYTSIYNKSGRLEDFIRASFKLTLIITVMVSIGLLLLAGVLSNFVFDSPEFKFPFYYLAFSLILYSINTYFNSFLNGISNFKIFNTLNIINSLFSLLITITLVYWMGLKGALLSVVLSQTLTSAATFWYLLKFKMVFKGFQNVTIDKALILKLLPFVKMTFFSGILLPASQIIIRKIILHFNGKTEMGFIEAINRISGVYLLLILNIMIMYYLPRIALAETKTQVRKEITKGALMFGGMLVAIGMILFLFKHLWINLFLSVSFDHVSDLILPQLCSDLFKILYYLFAYFVISKSMSTYYIISELIFFTIYLSIAYIEIPALGAKGAVYANLFMNFFALIFHAFFIGKIYFNKKNNFTRIIFGAKTIS